MTARHRPLRRVVVLALGAVLLIAGGVAWATIPEAGTGLIHSCYNTSTGALRVIDPSKGQSCAAKGIHFRGGWNSTTAYAIGDAVTWNGSAFIAKAANTNSMPPSSNWAVLADKPYANVFSDSNASNPGTFPIIISSNLTQVAQTTGLPAGNYVVNAQAVVFMDNGAQGVVCDLEDSHGNFAIGTAETSGPPDGASTGTVQTLSLTDAYPNVPAGTKILLKCAKGNGADANASEVSSAAISVSQTGNMVFNGTTFPSK